MFNTPIKHVILTRMGDQLSAAKGTLVNFVVKYVKRRYRNTTCRTPFHSAARCSAAGVCNM